MPRKIVPKLVRNKKTGKRYILYNKKRYSINSRASDRYIIKNFFDIIKQLIQKRRRTKRVPKSELKIQANPPTISGSASDLAKIKSYTETNKIREATSKLKKEAAEAVKKIEDTKKEIKLLTQQSEKSIQESKELLAEPDNRPLEVKFAGAYNEMQRQLGERQAALDDLKRQSSVLEENNRQLESLSKIAEEQRRKLLEEMYVEYVM